MKGWGVRLSNELSMYKCMFILERNKCSDRRRELLNLPAFYEIMTDRPTSQQTNVRVLREVTLPKKKKTKL